MNEETTGATSAEAPTATPTPAAKPTKAKPVKKQAAKAKPKARKGVKLAKGEKGPQVLRKYAPGYHKDKERKTAGGHTSVDCNDKLAAQLRGKDLDAVYAFAAKTLKEPETALRAKYKGLNVGMQRMNLGNRCRAALTA